MLEHVAIQQSSCKTIASYAKQIGVTRHKMQYWVNKYKASQDTTGMVCIGQEITEELDYTPARLFRNSYIRNKHMAK